MEYKSQKPELWSSYFGEWWLKEEFTKKITGNLKIYSNGNYLLETNGFFQECSKHFATGEDYKIDIYGLAKEGSSNTFDAFRLVHCFYAGRSIGSLAFDYRKTHVSYFLKCKANSCVELEKFNRILLNTLNLDLWIDDNSLDHNAFEGGYEQTYKARTSEQILKSDFCTINIGSGFSYSYPNHKGFTFKYLPSFEILFKRTLDEKDTRDIANKLNWFISLCCFSPTYILLYQLNNTETEETVPTAQLIYHDKFVDDSYKEIKRHELLITYNDFKSNPNLLSQWLTVVDENPLLVKNFFGVLRNSSDFVENKFLSLINGILTFAEQKIFINKMTNEKSLFELFQLYKECWSSFYKPKKSSINEMVGRRHILVHNSDRIDSTKFKDDDFRLNWFSTQLQFVSLAIILRELDFSDKEIENRLAKLALNRTAFDEINF